MSLWIATIFLLVFFALFRLSPFLSPPWGVLEVWALSSFLLFFIFLLNSRTPHFHAFYEWLQLKLYSVILTLSHSLRVHFLLLSLFRYGFILAILLYSCCCSFSVKNVRVVFSQNKFLLLFFSRFLPLFLFPVASFFLFFYFPPPSLSLSLPPFLALFSLTFLGCLFFSIITVFTLLTVSHLQTVHLFLIYSCFSMLFLCFFKLNRIRKGMREKVKKKNKKYERNKRKKIYKKIERERERERKVMAAAAEELRNQTNENCEIVSWFMSFLGCRQFFLFPSLSLPTFFPLFHCFLPPLGSPTKSFAISAAVNRQSPRGKESPKQQEIREKV